MRQSSTRWTDWGMLSNGNVLTAKISASPSQETACTLSDILMSDVEEKYFLSPKQQENLLFKPTAATKTGYQLAQVGDSIDLSYATVNSRRGRVGKQIAHTLTTGCRQGTLNFIDLNPDPKVTEVARCVNARVGNGIRTHRGESSGVLCEGRIRRLTPRECLRLQGWADDRIDTVLAIQSDNQAYKQAGNGVTVHVVEAIGRRIAKMDAELRGEALAP